MTISETKPMASWYRPDLRLPCRCPCLSYDRVESVGAQEFLARNCRIVSSAEGFSSDFHALLRYA